MKTTETNVAIIAEKIKQLDTREVMKLVSDIRKATKKKALSSGTQSFSEFCSTIATALTKQSTKSLIEKYNLA